MDLRLISENLLTPPILFFFLGCLAVFLRSDLEIPQPIPKFLSLYLLLSIGFRGGVELHQSGLTSYIALSLLAAMVMACAVPLYAFAILRLRLNSYDAAALAATYGSISAVTFITASAFLQRINLPYGGHLVAAMALMESPAIVIGILLARLFQPTQTSLALDWRELLREAFFNGPVFLVLGSLCIGLVTGENGAHSLRPFTEDIFKGLLAFFLLDMGLLAAKRLHDLRRVGSFLISFALLFPLVNAALGMGIAYALNMSQGDALMFTMLCASASYIAVPAAMRLSIPEANPSLYVPMALAITFPFNIIIGLPLYLSIIQAFWRTS